MKSSVLVQFTTAYGQQKTYVLTAFLDEVESLQRSVIKTLLWCNKENKNSEIFHHEFDEPYSASPPLMEPTLNGAFMVEVLPVYEMTKD